MYMFKKCYSFKIACFPPTRKRFSFRHIKGIMDGQTLESLTVRILGHRKKGVGCSKFCGRERILRRVYQYRWCYVPPLMMSISRMVSILNQISTFQS
uniref:Uncharacterized protein n=1 Tax=Arundo donax TaxID=35708 RepID=A0A0A8ZKU5_ARUDO